MSDRRDAVDYDKIGRIYDTSRLANPETLEKLTRLLEVGSRSVILDLGCGTGNYAGALGNVAKTVIGVDLSIGMLKQARAKFPSLQLVHGDVTSLPFASSIFDGALAVQVLHHVSDKEEFLREALRVVRDGGSIAIHACSHQQMRAFWFYHYFPRGLEVDLARMLDSREIASLLAAVGFSDIGIEICYSDVVVAGETPERYLDKNYRDSISTFAFLTEEEVGSGCQRIQEDIASGIVGSVVRQAEAKVADETGGSCIIYGRKTGGHETH